MKRLLQGIAILSALLACACGKAPLSLRMARSEMQRNPSAAQLDGMDGRLKWNYTTGLELKAILDADPSALSYVDAWYDAVISEDGRIGGGYKQSNFNLDHICPARTLFALYDLTGKEKYSAAIDSAYIQICNQPRTEAGAFWHKKVYPGQVWLDGLYMAEPFYAEYNSRRIRGWMESGINFDDIALQFITAYQKTYDPATGLNRHAWDETRSMFWADPETGQSQHAWGRAMGWYTMALAEVLDFFPREDSPYGELLGILTGILETLPRYADPETGMWYQVLDCPGREGNYTEATCSAMFSYVYLKAVKNGWLPASWKDYAIQTYRSLVRTFIREESDGTVSLVRCCAVAGLGGKDRRSGDYDYYIHEKITENDPKGVGPFIWASLIAESM